jgi:hypothetical protein
MVLEEKDVNITTDWTTTIWDDLSLTNWVLTIQNNPCKYDLLLMFQ